MFTENIKYLTHHFLNSFIENPELTAKTMLKEWYRMGKKQELWKLTRSNDADSWKHLLKYFCLKCHIWWQINNPSLGLEFITRWAFYSFLFWHRCNAKFIIVFSLFSCDPDGRLISNFYRFCQFIYTVAYIKWQQLFC